MSEDVKREIEPAIGVILGLCIASFIKAGFHDDQILEMVRKVLASARKPASAAKAAIEKLLQLAEKESESEQEE